MVCGKVNVLKATAPLGSLVPETHVEGNKGSELHLQAVCLAPVSSRPGPFPSTSAFPMVFEILVYGQLARN